MKPRLHVSHCPITEEDRLIKSGVAARQSHSVFDWKVWLDTMRDSDRRDADLMLFFMQLGWKRTMSTAYMYLRLQQAVDDPANWRTVVARNPDGSWSTTE